MIKNCQVVGVKLITKQKYIKARSDIYKKTKEGMSEGVQKYVERRTTELTP
jgi:hypothetical protein